MSAVPRRSAFALDPHRRAPFAAPALPSPSARASRPVAKVLLMLGVVTALGVAAASATVPLLMVVSCLVALACFVGLVVLLAADQVREPRFHWKRFEADFRAHVATREAMGCDENDPHAGLEP